jgi:hypothetical protein
MNDRTDPTSSGNDDRQPRREPDRDFTVKPFTPAELRYLHDEYDRKQRRVEDCRFVRNNAAGAAIGGAVLAIIVVIGGGLWSLIRLAASLWHSKP